VVVVNTFISFDLPLSVGCGTLGLFVGRLFSAFSGCAIVITLDVLISFDRFAVFGEKNKKAKFVEIRLSHYSDSNRGLPG